jgi:hypothetical protein
MDRAITVVDIRQLFGVLMNLAAALEVPLSELRRGETATTLVFEHEIDALCLNGFSFDVINAAVTAWADCLIVSFASEHGIRPLTAGPSAVNAESFADFMTDIATATSEDKVRVSMRVSKADFVQQRLPTVPGANVLLSVFRSNVVRALSGTFSEIQQVFFPDIYSRCVCLVLEDDLDLSGACVAVVGPSAFLAESGKKKRPINRRRIEILWQTRKDQVSWIDFETQLTPYHLMLSTPAGDGNHELIDAFAKKFYALALIHLADSVRFTDGEYVAFFGGLAGTVVRIPSDPGITPSNTAVLGRVLIWAYSERAPDKLSFVRGVSTSYLADDPAENYRIFAESLPRIWENARANYSSFIRGFVTRHFEKLREVDEYVRETGDKLGDQISDLVKNLTTNMLAAVGVVVGGFVAYALNPRASSKLLSIGLFIYGAYILLFPLLYSLIFHNLFDYLITTRDFSKRIGEFEQVLQLPGFSKRLADRVKYRKVHFWFMVVASGMTFLLIGLLCYHYALNLPDWINSPHKVSEN